MNIVLRSILATSAVVAASSVQAAQPTPTPTPTAPASFVFDTTTDGTHVGSGNGNALIFSDSKNVITMKATGWTRDFNGSFIASEIVPFIDNGLGIIQPGEGGSGAYHQIDNVNGWEFAILQFSQAVSLQSAKLNTFRLWDRNYVDNDAFIGWNSSNLSLANALTSAQARDLFDTRKGGFNSDSTQFNSNLQTYSRPSTDMSNVWIVGGSFGGPDGQNDAFKLAQLTVTAVPEPATWAMMLIGFGMIGGTMRSRRRVKVAYA
ncbi:PEPxxWA-CTERM sorting domain-containing protein [Sphingomonas floccifaciens]|uniref:PEPxxWA-CTERM sorting domain-containing protein n=1 Tax=Sphingomonas floccifaciens TaxID=1844115 RepID=A0ABW4NFP8_9SPHN